MYNASNVVNVAIQDVIQVKLFVELTQSLLDNVLSRMSDTTAVQCLSHFTANLLTANPTNSVTALNDEDGRPIKPPCYNNTTDNRQHKMGALKLQEWTMQD